MEGWHPTAASAPASLSGVRYVDDAAWKILLHSTEVGGTYRYNPNSYFGNPYWPHATIDEEQISQHLPITVGAYSLYSPGGTPTNAARVVQCEIMGYAADAHDWPDALLERVAEWVTWVAEQTGCPVEPTPFGFHGQGEGIVLATEDSPIRYGPQAWLDANCVLGHQHAWGNDHWDPGAFPWARFMAAVRRVGGFVDEPHRPPFPFVPVLS